MSSNDHDWFDEHATAYLMDGLSADDRARLESHAADCADCAAKLAALQQTDQTMNTLFASAQPSAGFEQKIIDGLARPMRLPVVHLNPFVRRAAVAAAAVIVLGGVGYVASDRINNDRWPTFSSDSNSSRVASSMRQIGQAVFLYSYDNKARYPVLADVSANPSGNTQKWNYGAGTNVAKEWSNFATETHHRADAPDYPATDALVANHVGNGQKVLSGDRHAGFDENPFIGVQRDNIYTAPSPNSAAAPLATLGDANDSILLPTADDEKAATAVAQPANKQKLEYFRPKAEVPKLADASGDSRRDLAKKAESEDESAPEHGATPVSATPTAVTTAPAAVQSSQLKVIRNGTMDFIVDSFDSALLQVTAIVAEEGGYVGTTNSQKMPNGKVSGAITIRIAPDHLDVLVLKLRALGELKEQKITAEDVTKEYTDLASELRAARAMEDRLLDLIKDGKGSIKDLLSAEKELGDWREKIEKITGQINYYDNLVAMSTLELTLTEKDIKTPALASQTETVDMGVETEDVEKARNDAISAVDEIKGRIVESELKQFDAGELAGKIVADVSPDKAGPLIDHLKQLGTVSRLEIQRQEVTTDGLGNPVNADTLPPGLRVAQKDTRLTLSLYNLANVAPRQTANVELACDDVEASYHAILDRVGKAGGRVLSSNLSRPTPDQVTATVSFETKSADADGVLMDVKQAGDVMQSSLTENTDTNNVTSSKRGFSVQLRSLASVNPREVRTLSVATTDVPAGYSKLLAQITGLKARVILSKLDSEQDAGSAGQNRTAGWLDFEVKRGDVDAVEHALTEAGDAVQRQILRSTDDQNTLDSKVQFKVGLHNAQLFPPHETWTLSVECGNVDAAQADVLSAANAAGGHVVDSTLEKEAGGKTTAHILVDVPLDQSAVVVDRVKHEGEVRVIQSAKNPQADEGRLARCGLDITINSPEAIVGGDRGLWESIRAGLATSVAGLLYSLQLIIIGLCCVGPWVAAIWVGWKVLKRRRGLS